MANRNYGDRGNEERNRDWGTGERSNMGWSQSEEEQRGRDWSGREGDREGGYGNAGGGYGAGREGDYGRDWQSGQSSQGGQWGQGGQGGYGNQGGYGGQAGYSGQGDRGSQGGFESQGGYGTQASQYGYSSGGGYTGRQSGQQWQGPHTGRGPQGYQRSNERIKEEVCEILTRHGQVDASGITVEVNNGEVTLTGTVNSRQEKRLAEECLEDLSGVRDIHNQLRVAGRGGNGGTQAEDLGSEASGVQPAQSARGNSTAGTENASETTKSRRRT